MPAKDFLMYATAISLLLITASLVFGQYLKINEHYLDIYEAQIDCLEMWKGASDALRTECAQAAARRHVSGADYWTLMGASLVLIGIAVRRSQRPSGQTG